MNGKILEVSVPGKLFIAGEYAVLEWISGNRDRC